MCAGEFVHAAFQAHSDLIEFVELGHLFDFDVWLKPMRNRLEEGIQVYHDMSVSSCIIILSV